MAYSPTESASDESQKSRIGEWTKRISGRKLAVSPFRPFTGSSFRIRLSLLPEMAFARTTALEFLRRAMNRTGWRMRI